MPETSPNEAAAAPAPAPVAAPAPAPVPESPKGGEGGGVDWGELNQNVAAGSDDDDFEPPPSDGKVTETAPPVEAKGTAQPPATTPEATPGEEGKTPPETPETPPQEPEEPVLPEATPDLTPEQKAEQETRYKEWRASMEQRLEEKYQFSEDEVAALQTEPERVLPKMAAKLFMDVQEAAVQSVLRFLPQAIGSVTQNITRDQAASNAFLAVNKDLADPKYSADIMDAARQFRAKNPKASPQEAILKIGKMVRALHDLPALEANGTAESSSSAHPSGKRTATPPQAHRPAGVGTTSAPKAAKKEENVWSSLADDEDDE